MDLTTGHVHKAAFANTGSGGGSLVTMLIKLCTYMQSEACCFVVLPLEEISHVFFGL